ncbi:DUF4190 domain-containing protein [Streptomyces sp. SID3343]|uniref:DUF4190 domain-containing protein n=1 Tax=Streptomyces sp. SID3343 TaxID=2690260 RepID=UPI00136A3CFB|nr:DUF4190 domain-containing protein [Streptomyces sp. SID3343]MYW04427.1 DUF4190 domain-containing protein [Streptomyces sp. SID3343]
MYESSAPPAYGQHMQQAPVRLRNGMGTSALVLGIIGAVSGVVPLMFWLAGILGLLALIFGLVGRSRAKRGEATNKGKATAGAILGLVSLILSVVGAVLLFKAAEDVVDKVDKVLNEDGVALSKGSPGTEAGKPLGADRPLPFNNGLSFTASPAKPYTDPDKPGKAVVFDVTVVNNGTKDVDLALANLDAVAGGGEKIYASADGIDGRFEGTLAPGKSVTKKFAFTVASGDKLVLEVNGGFIGNRGFWSLPVS